MERIYASAKKEVRNRSFPSVLLVILCFIIFILVSFFLRGSYNELREELIGRLKNEKEIIDTNNRLKMELSGITQARYLEFKAKERLGLKKPKEEEVLVLR